jgi:hypothetical protein
LKKKSRLVLPESSLHSAKFQQEFRDASKRSRIHHDHSASKKTGARKRGYLPIDMEHGRMEHKEGDSIIFNETRGVRDSSTVFLYSDFNDTLSLGNHVGYVDADMHASLFEAANLWLQEAGEKDFFETNDDAEKTKQSVRTKKQKGRIDRSTFQRWWFEIGMKRGFLSPTAIAANFITASNFVHRLAKGNQQLERAIYQFADAWHWMHFEARGEHKLADIGWKSAKGRAAGPAMKKRRAEMKKQIAHARYHKFASDEKNGVKRTSAKGAAGALLEPVNQELKKLKLDTFSEGKLEDELRPLIKECFPKPAKKKRKAVT